MHGTTIDSEKNNLIYITELKFLDKESIFKKAQK